MNKIRKDIESLIDYVYTNNLELKTHHEYLEIGYSSLGKILNNLDDFELTKLEELCIKVYFNNI